MTAEKDRMLPSNERVAKALEHAGFDESDTSNAVDALGPFIRDYDRIDAQRDDAVGAIQDAVLLIRAFDPTCGSGRTRAFLGDLESLLRGRP